MTYFETLDFSRDFAGASDTSVCTLFVCASGYESRSLHLLNHISSTQTLGRREILVFSFLEYRDNEERVRNDDRLAELRVEPILVSGTDYDAVLNRIGDRLQTISERGFKVRLVIDYSSMPRLWYCNLCLEFLRSEYSLDVEFWYVRGDFFPTDYPCVGYGNFNVFSGLPRVTRTKEIYVFGLGFDSTRTYGIWNFLDPQHTKCLIGESADNADLVSRVIEQNHEILTAASYVTRLRLENFGLLVSSITDLARKNLSSGDVSLVADGPKPLVMAMSLCPSLLHATGVVAWHVSHVKPDDYAPPNVRPTEYVYGFAVKRSLQVEV